MVRQILIVDCSRDGNELHLQLSVGSYLRSFVFSLQISIVIAEFKAILLVLKFVSIYIYM